MTLEKAYVRKLEKIAKLSFRLMHLPPNDPRSVKVEDQLCAEIRSFVEDFPNAARKIGMI